MPLQAFAYLDPGAGSFILQMLIAGIMGGLFTMKLYWYKLKEWMNKLLGKEVASLDEDADIENGNDKIEK
jgi:hypothetical protein